MPELINTNDHRIYYGENAENVVRKGQTFTGSDDDAERPGVLAVDSDEGQAYLEAQENLRHDASDADALQTLSDLSLLARGLGTARLRDEIDSDGHRVPGTGETRNPNAPSAPPPDQPVNLPPPETSQTVESGGVTSGVPGHDVAHTDPDHLSVPAIADRIGDEVGSVADGAAADGDEVEFASGRAAEVADELNVSEADIATSQVEPSGDDGEYTADDVRAVAEARDE